MKTNVAISSLDVYTDLKESGELSARRLEVCEVLSKWANISCHSICKKVNANPNNKNTYPSSISGRLNELVEMGIVEQSLERTECEVTQNMVHKYSLKVN